MKLNEILILNDISPKDVAIILSRPRNEKFRRGLLEGLIENNALNITYASHQTERATKTLASREFGALFVPIGGGQYILTGFYRVVGCVERDADYFDNCENYSRLKEYSGFDIGNMCRKNERPTQIVELETCEVLDEFVGRVIIAPKKKQGEMAYMRLAETLDPSIIAIREHGWNPSPAPDWNNFIMSASEIRSLPKAWQARLKEWRGVYLIVDEGTYDESTGDRYVGSAYGAENLLSRWQAHVSGKNGITKELSKRDPVNFRFSILQLLAPDAQSQDVISIEHNWMRRLHTKEFGLNS